MNIFKNAKKEEIVINGYNIFLQKWGVDYKETDIIGKYGLTHCIEVGDRNSKPLFLFHGVGDNSAVMWVLNIKELSKKYFCIAVDTLGGPGKSKPNTVFKNEFIQEEWINEIINHYKYEKIDMVGVSNGGYMAYNFCEKFSNKIGKIVCIEGGFILNPILVMMKTIGLMFPEILLPTRKNMIKILYKMSSPHSSCFQENGDIADYMIDVMTAHNQSAMFVHKIHKYNEEYGKLIKDKCLFLFGDYRLDINKDIIEIINRDGFTLKIIENAGHGLNMEQFQLVNREILNFV